MNLKIAALLTAVAMTAALTACAVGGNTVSSTDVSASDSAVSSETPSSEETWNPTVAQRAALREAGSMCGVVYLGYADYDAPSFADDKSYYLNLLQASGYADTFDFLLSVPDDHWVSTPAGQELYLIIPCDENAKVSVNCWNWEESGDDLVFSSGDNLYTADNGAPLILRCNYSDIIPNCEVVITDSSGETLTWHPFISLKDGTVDGTADDGKTLYDFTEYPFEIEE